VVFACHIVDLIMSLFSTGCALDVPIRFGLRPPELAAWKGG